MPSKIDLTEQVLTALGSTEWNLDLALKSWWCNIRDGGGLQLTVTGYRIFRDQARMPCHDFDIDVKILIPRNLIVLDRKMTCAYAITKRRGIDPVITMFGDQEAMVAMLYGDLRKWIQNLQHQ